LNQVATRLPQFTRVSTFFLVSRFSFVWTFTLVFITALFAQILLSDSVFAKEDPKKIEARKAADPHSLIIHVFGFANSVGDADITVYDSKENYTGGEKPFKHVRVKVWYRDARFIIENCPYGFFAARAYHDQNKNKRLDRALTGDPTEAFGYSRGTRHRYGRPKWEEICETFDAEHRTIEIELK
jgi:uncharacterized protein (DUF2141 family)